jgi:ferredoxin--NADP+ reductase/benzoate/toluate 1,2-dioxygenase reductase subunit
MNRRPFNLHKILEKRELTDSTFVLRFERLGLEFKPGQHISVGPPNGIHTREYSIYNAPSDDYLEILVKEVIGGLVSPALNHLKVGDSLVVQDPVGYFTLDADKTKKEKFLFIASGTGISPFHSFIQANPHLNYRLLHGVRYGYEDYERSFYGNGNLVVCSSRDGGGHYQGRVTHYLQEMNLEKDLHCFVCGNCDMIHDVYDILEKKGIPSEQIHAEVYF